MDEVNLHKHRERLADQADRVYHAKKAYLLKRAAFNQIKEAYVKTKDEMDALEVEFNSQRNALFALVEALKIAADGNIEER